MSEQVDKLRSKKLELQSAASAAGQRGREVAVIPTERLLYYQKLEGMLAEALELAAAKPAAPIVVVKPEDIRREVSEALSEVAGQVEGIVANTLAKLTGLASEEPAAIAAEVVETRLPRKAADDSDPAWQPMRDLIASTSPKPGQAAVWAAVYANKIRKRGRGKKALLSVADYGKWLQTYKPRS